MDVFLEKLLHLSSNITEQSAFTDSVAAFINAIDWSERLFAYLLIFHVIMFVIVLWSWWWDRQLVQIGVLTLLLVLVLPAKWINMWATVNWQLLAKQPYFDHRGHFISVVYSAPLVLMSLFLVIPSIVTASKLLIVVKRKQLQQKLKERVKEGGESPSEVSEEAQGYDPPQRSGSGLRQRHGGR